MYKVFINDITLIILNRNEKDYKLLWPKATVYDGVEFTPQQLLDATYESEANHLILVAANGEKFFQSFKELFIIVHAAGGIVNLNHRRGAFLMIYRHGKWDLPKGKIESGESAEAAAIREVTEECGIKKLRIRNHYETTFHTYQIGKKRYLKVTDWFRMTTTDQSEPKPQSEEGIEKAQWVIPEEISSLLKNSYRSIRDLMTPLING